MPGASSSPALSTMASPPPQLWPGHRDSRAGESGHIHLGTYMEIKCSDGHFPPALVMEFHESTSSITVEWLEKGANKSKQVDLQLIFALNPHLAPRSASMTSIDAPLSAKGRQSLLSEWLSMYIKAKQRGHLGTAVALWLLSLASGAADLGGHPHGCSR